MESTPRLEDLPLLSPSEWRVFFALSQRSEATVRQLEADIDSGQAQPMSYATIQVLVRRLEEKGYVHSRRPDREKSHLYRGAYPFNEVLRRHATESLATLCQGNQRLLLTVVRDILEDLLSKKG